MDGIEVGFVSRDRGFGRDVSLGVFEELVIGWWAGFFIFPPELGGGMLRQAGFFLPLLE